MCAVKRVGLLAVCLAASAAFSLAQQTGGNGVPGGLSAGAGATPFVGAPTGNCSSTQTAVDTTTGNYYSCNNGVWQKVGPAAGGAPSGTAGGSLAGNYPNPSLAAQAANTLLGNNTGSSAAPAALTISQVASLLGLGTAASQPATAFDAAGAASNAQAASLQKTGNLADLASAAAARTNLGLGTAATQASTAFDASGAATTAQANAIAASAPSICANGSYACSASPALTGTPTAPTQPISTNNTDIATTAAVTSAIAGISSAVSSVFGRSGPVVAAANDYTVAQIAGAAPLASPALTGTPTAPTQPISTNNTDIATTAAVTSAIAGISSAVSSVFGRTGPVVAAANDYTVAQVAGAAPLASPALTGAPTAPTQAISTNSTAIATTAAVSAAIPTTLPSSGAAGGALSGTYPNPVLASAIQVINGVSYSAAYPQTTLVARLNACMLDAINLTNGNTSHKCDSTGEADVQTDTTGSTIAVGNSSGTQITWAHPPVCHWTLSGYSGGTADLLDLYGGSSIEGPTPVNNPCLIVYGGGTNAAYAVFQTMITTATNTYFKVKGMGFIDSSASLASGATAVFNSTADGSVFEDLLITNYEPGQSAILLNNVQAYGQCCATTFNRVVANGNYSSGPIVKILATNTYNQYSTEFTNSSFTHPGVGYPVIQCTSGNTAQESLYFDNIYEELNKNDTTTPANISNGCLAIKVSGMSLSNPGASSSSTGPIWQLNGTLLTSLDISGLSATHNIAVPAIAVQNNISGYNCASTPCNVYTDANGNLGHYTNSTFQGDVINASVGFNVAGSPLAVGNVAGAAPLASPALTGTPTAPTQAISTNSTAIATTAAVTSALGPYAPLASPALTGTPTAPTAAAGTNTTQVATTAYVLSALPAGYYGGTSTGAVNVLAISLPSNLGTPTLAQLTGIPITFIPNLANTTNTPTLTINALAAATIVKGTSTALAAGDLATGATALVIYNGANFVLQNPQVTITQTNAVGSFTVGSSGTLMTQGVRGLGTTGNLTAQGGQDAASASALGSIIVRGANNSTTGSAGSAILEGGANTGTGNQGLANVQQSFTIGATTTVGYVVTMTTTADRVQVAAAGARGLVGVAASVGGTNAQLYVATEGKIFTVFDGTPVVGDYACGPPSGGTAGLAHDNGAAPCPVGQSLGIVTGQVSGTGSGATATVLLRILTTGSSNCSSSASPAVCSAAANGFVAVPAGGTTLVVGTTAVTANSQIMLTFDSSLGAKLGVTCNTTINQPSVSGRAAGTSFTITMSASIATNPDCLSYTIVN